MTHFTCKGCLAKVFGGDQRRLYCNTCYDHQKKKWEEKDQFFAKKIRDEYKQIMGGSGTPAATNNITINASTPDCTVGHAPAFSGIQIGINEDALAEKIASSLWVKQGPMMESVASTVQSLATEMTIRLADQKAKEKEEENPFTVKITAKLVLKDGELFMVKKGILYVVKNGMPHSISSISYPISTTLAEVEIGDIVLIGKDLWRCNGDDVSNRFTKIC